MYAYAWAQMLEVGIGLNTVESQTHFAGWVVTSAPLAIGFDLTNETLYNELYPIIANKQAISINQQWAGNPGNLVANSTVYREYATEHGADGGFLPEQRTDLYPTWQVWRKPLTTPTKGQAVLVINLSDEPQDVTVRYVDVDAGLGDDVVATDVWTGQQVSVGKSAAVLKGIEPHGNVFLVLKPGIGSGDTGRMLPTTTRVTTYRCPGAAGLDAICGGAKHASVGNCLLCVTQKFKMCTAADGDHYCSSPLLPPARGIRWAVNEPAAVAPWLLHGATGWANTSQPVSSATVGIIVQPVFSITTSGKIVASCEWACICSVLH